jgi:hypothetical protein
MTESRPCPSCGSPVQVDWNWCHACGYDPAGRKPAGWVPSEPLEAPAGMVPLAPPPNPEPPSSPAPPTAYSVPGFDTTPPEAIPTPRVSKRSAGNTVSLVIIAVACLLAVGAVVYVVQNGADTKKAPTATPAFTAGLPILFSINTDAGAADQVPSLPEALAGCAEAKLSPSDVTAISALQVPSDVDKVPLGIQIRAIRAARGCDRVGVAEAMTGQGNAFSDLGVHSLDQQQCVMEHFEDGVAAQDDSSQALVSDATILSVMAPAFQACVPLSTGLAALLAGVDNPPPPDVAACIARAMAPSSSWIELFTLGSDPAAQAQFTAGLTAARGTCG